MAEKKNVERKFVPVDDKKEVKANADGTAEAEGKTSKSKATTLRIVACILWLVAIAFEVLVILLLNGYLYIPGDITTYLIIGIAADLVFVIVGSLLWKKGNRLDPVSKKNKVKFYLWNEMGVIISIIAFFPLIIFLLKDKDLEPKTKKLVTVIAAIALIIASLFSFDFNPPSAEDLSQASTDAYVYGDGTAYWTRWGRSYHFDPDCQTLQNSEVIYQGDVDDAFAANRTDPCDFCAGGAEQK